MTDSETLSVDPKLKELLARNVPKKFNKSVDRIRDQQRADYEANRSECDFKFGEIVRCIHPSPSFKNTTVLAERIKIILDVYLAMKGSVDQVVDPKSVARELTRLQASLHTVEARLRDEVRDKHLVNRLGIDAIERLGRDADAFDKAGQLDEKVAIVHLAAQHMLSEVRKFGSYFDYKAGNITGGGRRKNDYSLHYIVFALAELFNEVGKMDGAIMVSFNDDDEPTGAFWKLVITFFNGWDETVPKEYKGSFPEMIKTVCRRFQKAGYSTDAFTRNPDTQRLLDFMAAIHVAKSTKH